MKYRPIPFLVQVLKNAIINIYPQIPKTKAGEGNRTRITCLVMAFPLHVIVSSLESCTRFERLCVLCALNLDFALHCI